MEQPPEGTTRRCVHGMYMPNDTPDNARNPACGLCEIALISAAPTASLTRSQLQAFEAERDTGASEYDRIVNTSLCWKCGFETTNDARWWAHMREHDRAELRAIARAHEQRHLWK